MKSPRWRWPADDASLYQTGAMEMQDETYDLRKRDRWCIGLMVVGPLVPLALLLLVHYANRLPLPQIGIPLQLFAVVVIGCVTIGLVAGLRLVFAWWAPLWIKALALPFIGLSLLLFYWIF